MEATTLGNRCMVAAEGTMANAHEAAVDALNLDRLAARAAKLAKPWRQLRNELPSYLT